MSISNRSDIQKVDQPTELLRTIDPDPVPTDQAKIVGRREIEVNGEPACRFTIRYPDTIDQSVTWNDQSCSSLTTDFLSFPKLVEMGKVSRLPPETVEDLMRDNMVAVFYIENGTTASIFPLNVTGRIYEVTVAD